MLLVLAIAWVCGVSANYYSYYGTTSLGYYGTTSLGYYGTTSLGYYGTTSLGYGYYTSSGYYGTVQVDWNSGGTQSSGATQSSGGQTCSACLTDVVESSLRNDCTDNAKSAVLEALLDQVPGVMRDGLQHLETSVAQFDAQSFALEQCGACFDSVVEALAASACASCDTITRTALSGLPYAITFSGQSGLALCQGVYDLHVQAVDHISTAMDGGSSSGTTSSGYYGTTSSGYYGTTSLGYYGTTSLGYYGTTSDDSAQHSGGQAAEMDPSSDSNRGGQTVEMDPSSDSNLGDGSDSNSRVPASDSNLEVVPASDSNLEVQSTSSGNSNDEDLEPDDSGTSQVVSNLVWSSMFAFCQTFLN